MRSGAFLNIYFEPQLIKSPNLINWFLTTWRIGARFQILLQFRNLLQLLNNQLCLDSCVSRFWKSVLQLLNNQWCQGSSVSLFWKGELGTIKNNKCQLLKMARSCCHFDKIIKGPGTSFQSPAISQENIRNVCHTAH